MIFNWMDSFNVQSIQNKIPFILSICHPSQEKAQKPLKFYHFEDIAKFWAFSWNGWVQLNFWLNHANLLVKVLWIDTPHAHVLTQNISHFFIEDIKLEQKFWQPYFNFGIFFIKQIFLNMLFHIGIGMPNIIFQHS